MDDARRQHDTSRQAWPGVARPAPDQTSMRVGLIASLTTCVAAFLQASFTDGGAVADSFVRVVFPGALFFVSVADVLTTRLGVLPAQLRAADANVAAGDVAAFQRAASAMGLLAAMFIVAKGIYAVVVVVMTGAGWLAAPFAIVAIIEYAVFRSYLRPALDAMWRDRVRIGA